MLYRHPGTLRPYWASNSIGISLLMRVKLCAAMLNFQNQFTRSRPRSFTCRNGRSSFDQPKTRSINLRFRWLIARRSSLRSASVKLFLSRLPFTYSLTCGATPRSRNPSINFASWYCVSAPSVISNSAARSAAQPPHPTSGAPPRARPPWPTA